MFRISNIEQTRERFFNSEEEMINLLLKVANDGADMSNVRAFSNNDEITMISLGITNEEREAAGIAIIGDFWDHELV